jgi:putative aldouronate transport system permease protein
MWYILVLSFNDGADAMRGGIYFWPRAFTLDNYAKVLADTQIVRSFFVTVARTGVGTFAGVLFTAMVAFGLSKAYLLGRKLYLLLGIVTLMFNGGLIPYFLLLRDLRLLDNFLVFIIPNLFGFYNCMIFISFFQNLAKVFCAENP